MYCTSLGTLPFELATGIALLFLGSRLIYTKRVSSPISSRPSLSGTCDAGPANDVNDCVHFFLRSRDRAS